MSKLSKLMKHPVAFFVDAHRIKQASKGRRQIFVVGFSTWKTYLRRYFGEDHLIFIPKSISEKEFNSKFRSRILVSRRHCQVFIWGLKAPDFILNFINQNRIPARYVEDGFIRSIQLGATKTPPLSLCLDSRAPYFVADTETDLERSLNEFDPQQETALMDRARRCIELLTAKGVSKYNHGARPGAEALYGPYQTKRVLVIGQVEDDASILRGCAKPITNTQLVEIAVRENPDAQVIYKPHPDVMNAHRARGSDPREVAHICTVMTADVHLDAALRTIDHVYTITSLAGFEALLRGIRVTTLGAPFYSGWGLTDDRQPTPRRRRPLTLESLFAVAYLRYARYFDPDSGAVLQMEDVVERLAAQMPERAEPETTQRRPVEAVVAGKPLSTRTIYIHERLNANSMMKRHLERVMAHPNADLKIVWGDFRLPPTIAMIRLGADVHRLHIDAECFLPGATLAIKGKVLVSTESEDRDLTELLHYINVAHYKEAGDYLSLYTHYLHSPRANKKSLTLYAMRAGIYSQETLAGAVDTVLAEFAGLSASEKDLLLSKLHRVYGVKGPMEAVIATYWRHRQTLPANVLIKLVNLYCEAGDHAKALDLYTRSMRETPAIWQNKRFLALNSVLYRSGLSSAPAVQRDAELMDQLLDGQHQFEHYCRHHALAIVGNSPCELGLGKGEEIDRREKVVRFNSAITDFPQARDYGTRTDVLVTNPRYYETERNAKRDLDFAVVSDGCPYTTNQLSLKLEELQGQARQICLIPKRLESKLVFQLGASPSSGLKLLYWLSNLKGQLAGENLYGFSLNDQRYGTATSYEKAGNKVLNTIHDWEAEARLFEDMVAAKRQEMAS
ncbi:glycosyltransferase family 29 protein [Salinicola halophyticus]|uniref:glycosyltransferase family 29 protein n=1 Tax=Salinicola halophyticus TaxID=1808881 RepID=UPI003F44687E